MSVVEENPETAFVKGGLFVKSMALPKPAAEIFCERKEKWEPSVEGAQIID